MQADCWGLERYIKIAKWIDKEEVRESKYFS
jgi:hypothetical protein